MPEDANDLEGDGRTRRADRAEILALQAEQRDRRVGEGRRRVGSAIEDRNLPKGTAFPFHRDQLLPPVRRGFDYSNASLIDDEKIASRFAFGKENLTGIVARNSHLARDGPDLVLREFIEQRDSAQRFNQRFRHCPG